MEGTPQKRSEEDDSPKSAVRKEILNNKVNTPRRSRNEWDDDELSDAAFSGNDWDGDDTFDSLMGDDGLDGDDF